MVDDVLLCGVDEAGRGCVVGPLVVAAVAAEPRRLNLLRELGVADSKTLSRKRRTELFKQLRSGFRYEYVAVEPKRISSSLRVAGGPGLNDLEYRCIAELVEKIAPSKVFVDSPDRNPRRARLRILQWMRVDADVSCMVRGDRRHVLVAAASIVAKVKRDEIIENLKKRLGDFGSGYPSDPKTRRWLLENMGRQRLSRYVRLGWKTLDKMRQTRLDEF